jgi:cytochrome P450
MNAINEPIHWDPYSTRYFSDPHAAFRRLREEAPVYYNAEYDFYAVSRYEDVERGLADCETFSSARGDILELIKSGMQMPPGAFIVMDPPTHTQYRSALTKVFTPRRMAALEPQIRAFCAKALDPLVEGGEFNFVTDLGKEMPMRVIGMLLGIPEEDLKAVQQEADAKLITEAGKPMELQSENQFVGSGFEAYIDWRIKHPSDDLMTELLNVEFRDEKGEIRKFTRDEVVVICSILGAAGNETTNRLIGWTGKVLAEHPDQRRQVYENRALIPQTIEEILRYEPTGSSIARYVAKDAEFHGVKVPAGSAICMLVSAANRDPRKFANPDQFDINRERLPHLTFGYGFHACLGNALARTEGRIALDEVLNRFPDWEIDLDSAYITSTSTVRGWETLPAFTPKAKARRKAAPKPAAQPAAAPAAPSLEGAETWKITLQTPMGPQEMTAHLVRQGEALSGRIDSPMGSEPIRNGKVAGDTLTWTMAVTQPAAIELAFEVRVQGDAMSGHAQLGMFGKADLKGERVSA